MINWVRERIFLKGTLDDLMADSTNFKNLLEFLSLNNEFLTPLFWEIIFSRLE